MTWQAWTSAVRAAGFVGAVDTDAASRVVYGTDNSIYQLRPLGVVVPESMEDLAALASANHAVDDPLELAARGGGTGTNGQSLTNGVVVDVRRSMNRVLDIDVEGRTAVVQPGVVLGQLNAQLAEHGVFFAPHVSTSSRATIGGMVSTDAAGKGSLVHGRTNEHVIGVRCVLDDGTPWTFDRIDGDALGALGRRNDRIGALHRAVARATDGLAVADFPDLARGFTGYNLVGTRPPGSSDVDLSRLICGSEGTLALIGEVAIRLTPLPRETHLAVVAYPTFSEALGASTRLTGTSPAAIECLDERTISLAVASPAWRTVGSLVRLEAGALLLVEYHDRDGITALLDQLSDEASPAEIAVTSDPDEIAAVWKLRADAVGLLGQAVDGRRSVAFVEDCAVPPRHLEAFVHGFREILDRHRVSYGMFGHADVGCVHVRPALDLYDRRHEAMVREISDEVAALVSGFGGVLWGEHGRGFRGEFLDLPDDAVLRMRQVKTAFDPRNLLNPHKLYTPLDGDGGNDDDGSTGSALRRIDEVPLRVHSDRRVPVSVRDRFDSAFACNGNGLCHHWGDAEVMCPSYKVSADPRLSPKGRADLVRAWLHAEATGDRSSASELAADLHDSMAQCLSCGACTGRCPIRVDIPELKSRFLERRPEPARRRARTALLARFESMLPLAQRWAGTAAVLRRVADPVLERVLAVTDLPRVPTGCLEDLVRSAGGSLIDVQDEPGGADVVILPDAFTAYLEPSVLRATVEVLTAIGDRVALAPYRPSRKLDHVKGRRRRFAAAVADQRRLVESVRRPNRSLVVIEPAVALLADHEFPAVDAGFPVDAVYSLPGLLESRIDRIAAAASAAAGRGSDGSANVVRLFGHCTEVSLRPDAVGTYRSVLEAVGWSVRVESTSCCGMAGVFGHEAENREMSEALFDLAWRPRLGNAASSGDRCAAPGYSCRSQSRRLGDVEVVHPIELVADALR